MVVKKIKNKKTKKPKFWQIGDLVDDIREINEQTNEVVKRKLDNQADFVKRAGIFNKPETYDKNASKVTRGSSAKAFREV